MDRHDLYELTVQSPRHVVRLLKAIHGQAPLVLREDFCGTAAVSIRWALDAVEADEPARACAVDLDPEVIERARARAAAMGVTDRVTLLEADALLATPGGEQGADVIFVGNFSIGEIHERRRLVEYLAASRARLAVGNAGFGGGVFVCDTYGGASAFTLGVHERTHIGRRGEIVKYAWEHEAADPLTGLVTNSISFRVIDNGEVTADLPRAFVYRWRLWSIAELRDAMREAGFVDTEVYKDLGPAPGEAVSPADDPAELGSDWIVCVAGRA